MLNWLYNNYLLVVAIVVLSVCLTALILLPSRKKMMLGEATSSEKRVPFAYASSALAFVFVLFLLLEYFFEPAMFKKLIGTLFLYSNMLLCGGIGMVLATEARWVSNFSKEADMPRPVPRVIRVDVVEGHGVRPIARPVEGPMERPMDLERPMAQPMPRERSEERPNMVRPMVQTVEGHGVRPTARSVERPVEHSVTPALQLKCPLCQQEMLVPHEMMGHIVSCPHCGVEGRIGGVAQ
ncbi:MAG: hypothetical protein KAT70_09965 [Thermoplasmata archaeon]|nr:hypothetical protein [Thermoplasmata archaeon]